MWLVELGNNYVRMFGGLATILCRRCTWNVPQNCQLAWNSLFSGGSTALIWGRGPDSKVWNIALSLDKVCWRFIQLDHLCRPAYRPSWSWWNKEAPVLCRRGLEQPEIHWRTFQTTVEINNWYKLLPYRGTGKYPRCPSSCGSTGTGSIWCTIRQWWHRIAIHRLYL